MTDTLASKLLELVEPKFGHPERCGVITAAGEVREIPNVHLEPEKGFHMDPTCFLSAIDDGAVATWHTHPGRDPNLSEEDLVGFQAWPELEHHIVGVRDGKPTVHSFKVLDDGVVVSA